MKVARPPLHVHLLAHTRSAPANQIAHALMARLVEAPASGGLRVPVFFTPDWADGLPPRLDGKGALNLQAADHTLIVVLADSTMLRTVPCGTGNAWKDFVRHVRAQTPLDGSPHHLLPVALDRVGFGINEECHVLPAFLDASLDALPAKERQLAELSFHIAARAIQLLAHGKIPAIAPDRVQAPVRIFLSHAKADLSPARNDPVHHTAALCASDAFPIEGWFDARNIATSQDFWKAISAGIRDSSIMLAFKTDHYSSRPWCRREVVEAKRLGAHILMVNAVESGEARSFPYGGNVPVIRWNLTGEPEVEARRIIDRAVLEALRFQHNRALLAARAEIGDEIWACAPEALTLADIPDNATGTCVLYPDPPLGREELEVLHKLRPRAQLITPLTRLAAKYKPKAVHTLCVGISESGDAHHYGLSNAHFATLSDEIYLYLLLAGFKIAYGGSLSGSFDEGNNFTLRLFELIRGYSGLAEGVNAPSLKKAILNVAPWPLRLGYGEKEWALFDGDCAEYQPGPRPNLPGRDDDIFPIVDGKRSLAADTPEKRYAWARGLTAMRQAITGMSGARLVLGGKMTGHAGLVPGVIEEAWLSLSQHQPLYLAGGYGGAARVVCDLLQGFTREEFSETWAVEHIKDYQVALASHLDGAEPLLLLPAIGQAIAGLAGPDLGKVLNNGLNDGENRELMICTDTQRIAELVLQGLGRL